MSTLTRVLDEVRRRGIELEAAGDRIRFRPKAAVTSDLAASLQRHKPELLELLRTYRAGRDAERHRPSRTPARLDQRGRLATKASPVVGDRAMLEAMGGYAWFVQQTAGMTFDEVSQWIRDNLEDPPINDGSDPLIPVGWSRPAWIRELRRMACECEGLHPDIAAQYRQQADSIPTTQQAGRFQREPDRYPRPGGGWETFVERAERYRRECGGPPPGMTRLS
jgi:hypothetical protein